MYHRCRTWVVCALVFFAFAAKIGTAQQLDVTAICGGPDESLSEQERTNLAGQAQSLVSSSDVRAEAARQVSRIVVDQQRSDLARELHFLDSISCAIIISDRAMSTDEKLKRISALREGLQLPTEQKRLGELTAELKSPGVAIVEPGNTSQYVGNGRWDWAIFIRGSPEEIAKINCVVYHLHPTFPNPDRKVCVPGPNSSQAFPLSSNGWGTFTVAIDLEGKDGSVRRILYPLTFSRG